jgi:hypothetical protein
MRCVESTATGYAVDCSASANHTSVEIFQKRSQKNSLVITSITIVIMHDHQECTAVA